MTTRPVRASDGHIIGWDVFLLDGVSIERMPAFEVELAHYKAKWPKEDEKKKEKS